MCFAVFYKCLYISFKLERKEGKSLKEFSKEELKMEEIKKVSLEELEELEEIVVPDNGALSCCNL